MGCEACGYTGIAEEYDETAGPGYITVPCPNCHGVEGDMPDAIADLHDAATQAEIEEAWVQHELDKAAQIV